MWYDERTMIGLQTVATHWWVILLRGIVALLFGILCFTFPISAVAAFVILFGAYALVDGVLTIVAAIRLAHPDSGRWWWLLIEGIVGVAVGVLTFSWPGITAIALGFLVAAWAIATGALEIGAAVRMRKDVPGEILFFVTGLLSIFLGVILAIHPLAGVLAGVFVIGIYALLAGFFLIFLSFRLRGLKTA
jgi:uncharacterized membrane protein HdeD (DUF308 family)